MAITELLHAQCNECSTRSGHLSKCGGCKVVNYCSKVYDPAPFHITNTKRLCKSRQEHQAADWSTHKIQCTPVKRARLLFEKEEAKLRNFPGDFSCPPNPLEQPEPHFWGWYETRPYMRARYGFLDSLRKIKTREAVQAALDHTKGCLRLCRGDNMGVRDMVPAMMLRLGQDQDAYDFMKWYATEGQRDDYDWGDLSLPFLNLKEENAFESLASGDWTHKYGDVAHKIAITLLKLRLLLDLYSLQNSVKIAEQLPQELIDNVRQHLTSEIVARNDGLMQQVRDGVSVQPWVDNVESQMDRMFSSVHESNKHFWSALIDPCAALTARPESYSMGSREEMQLKLQYSYEAWEETPGAIDWVRKKLRE